MNHTVFRLRKLWWGLKDPVYRRALRFGVGATIEHAQALSGLDFDAIIDVGANRGQFATFARRHFRHCRIIGFEPLAVPASVFEAVFKNDALTRLVRAAISPERGLLTMHVTKEDDSSSLLEVGETQKRAFGTVVTEKLQVTCGPLSDFIGANDLGSRNLLKIDTQGFELEVLKGADDLLERFSVVYCELSFVELYVGQALASEVISYLFDRGLHLAGIYNVISIPKVGAAQADALFVRR